MAPGSLAGGGGGWGGWQWLHGEVLGQAVRGEASHSGPAGVAC